MLLPIEYAEEESTHETFMPGLHLVIDKFPLFRNGLSSLIKNLSPAAQIAEMSSIREFEKKKDQLKSPTLITLDLHLEDSLGLSGIQTIRRHYKDTPLLLFCNDASARIEKLCVNAGATICISKSSPTWLIHNELAKHIPTQSVSASNIPTISEIRLTRRMRQLMLMIGRGLSNEEIGDELGLTIHTVKLHLYRLYKRLNVHSRTQAIAMGHQMGWIL